MALGLVLAARGATRFVAPPAAPARQRMLAAAMGVLAVTRLLGPGIVGLLRSPPPVSS
jgi:hypothetical protein